MKRTHIHKHTDKTLSQFAAIVQPEMKTIKVAIFKMDDTPFNGFKTPLGDIIVRLFVLIYFQYIQDIGGCFSITFVTLYIGIYTLPPVNQTTEISQHHSRCIEILAKFSFKSEHFST